MSAWEQGGDLPMLKGAKTFFWTSTWVVGLWSSNAQVDKILLPLIYFYFYYYYFFSRAAIISLTNKAPSEIQSDMSQTSKAQRDADMTLKLRDDMMKNLKMWEDVTKTLKMSDAIKTTEMRGDTT